MGEGSKAESRRGRVIELPAGKAPSRGRATKFDRDAARNAWRQVARIRSARPLPSARSTQAKSGWGWWIGFAAVAVGLVWIGRDADHDSPPHPTPESVTASSSPQPTGVAEAPIETAGSNPLAVPGGTLETDRRPSPSRDRPQWIPEDDRPPLEGIDDEGSDATDEAEERPSSADSSSSRTRSGPRVAPPGTPADSAEAYLSIPQADDDRPPLGGIAGSGLHVDRVAIGTEFAEGRCHDQRQAYSVDQHGYVNVCFRAVHHRVPEFVLVRWERDGELVRRTWVRIPAAHGWRTRAGLPLRDLFVGSWTVRVMSDDDGVELASARFTVQP